MKQGQASGDIPNYKPPTGPMGIDNRQVGLGGDNCSNSGSQGPKDCGCGSSGSPGIGGSNNKAGSQR